MGEATMGRMRKGETLVKKGVEVIPRELNAPETCVGPLEVTGLLDEPARDH